jgi:H+/Cl- antiporter ClcA
MLAKVATWSSGWGGLWFNFAYWYFLLLIFVPLSMSVAVPGGVFMPSFAFGALTGRLYGALMIRLFPSFSFQVCLRIVQFPTVERDRVITYVISGGLVCYLWCCGHDVWCDAYGQRRSDCV